MPIPLYKDNEEVDHPIKAAVAEALVKMKLAELSDGRKYRNSMRRFYAEFKDKFEKRGWTGCAAALEQIASENQWILDPLESETLCDLTEKWENQQDP